MMIMSPRRLRSLTPECPPAWTGFGAYCTVVAAGLLLLLTGMPSAVVLSTLSTLCGIGVATGAALSGSHLARGPRRGAR
jgi:hypothetical protein